MSASCALDQAPPAPVLVVDDEAAIRVSMQRVLSLLGYEVDVASTGGEALDMVARTAYGAAIFDIRLPDMDGMEVMRRARDIRPSMSAIILTGYGSLDTAVEAVRAQAVDYLRKPATVRQVARAITAALERRDSAIEVGRATADRFVRAGPLTLDREQRLATVTAGAGFRVAGLTQSEAAILSHLMSHPGAAISCRELAGTLGYAEKEGQARLLVRPHISRLRQKIELDPASPRFIITIFGLGYTVAATHPPDRAGASGP